MKVGSLVRNKSSRSVGIVIDIGEINVRIHWVKRGFTRTWSRDSKNLEVICE